MAHHDQLCVLGYSSVSSENLAANTHHLAHLTLPTEYFGDYFGGQIEYIRENPDTGFSGVCRQEKQRW